MRIRFFVVAVLAMSLVLPAAASAQGTPEASPVPADATDFFVALDGYGGGAEITYTSSSLDPAGLLIVTASVAQFESEAAAGIAFAAATSGYETWLEGPIDPAFDLSKVNQAKNVPEIGEETLLFRGNATSRTDSASTFAAAILVVREGSTIVSLIGLSVTGDAVELTGAVQQAVLSRAPAAATAPVDGTAADAAIWAWLPAPEDMTGNYTVVARAWRDAGGTEHDAPTAAS